MCGITGIFAFNQIGTFYMINLAKATDKLTQRGPDGRGVYIEDFVAMGHRRLSIIDTSYLGNQPMSDSSKRYTIVFNGEIFNYKELKSELETKGENFISGSDTEVLLKLYIREGDSCLNKLTGFFSFAIYDKQAHELFIARDRMGVKPLIYYYDEDKFVFSSELKSLMAYNIPKELNYEALYTYLQLNYIPHPATIYSNVFKLLPGHYVRIKNNQIKTEKYYEIPWQANGYKEGRDYESIKNKLVEVLDASVQSRMVADVPVGAFLSGGIDSSVAVALASRYNDKLKTYSIGFADEPFFDETKYAELVAKKFNTSHTVFSLRNDDLLDNLDNVLNYIDEPFGDSSALAVYILSKYTSKEVKVALSGDGADELFGGYNKYLGELKLREGGFVVDTVTSLDALWSKLPKSRNGFLSNKVRQFHRLSEGKKLGKRERYWKWCSFADEREASSLLSSTVLSKLSNDKYNTLKNSYLRYFGEGNDLNEVFRTDVDLVLANDMLVKVDMMSMANGLELREPFLDHKVVEFAFSLPSSLKIDSSIKKKVLQDAFKEILPAELYNRPKKGFEVPLLKWFRRDLKSLLFDDLLHDKFIEEQGIFNIKEIRMLKSKLMSNDPGDVHARIWGLLVFQSWWKKQNFNKDN